MREKETLCQQLSFKQSCLEKYITLGWPKNLENPNELLANPLYASVCVCVCVMGFPAGISGKEPPCNARNAGDLGSIL